MKQDKLIHLYKKYSERGTPSLSISAKEQIKQRVLARIAAGPDQAAQHTSPRRAWSLTLVRVSSFAVLILAVLSGTAYASGSSMPGDTLYSVKRAVEGARLSFASTPESKAKLQVQFTEERIRELDTLETKAPEAKQTPKKTIAAPTAATLTAPEAATTTVRTTIAPDDEEKPTAHSEAEVRARREVLKAIGTLEQTKKNLNHEGKRGEAEDLDATITKLKNKVNVRSWREDRRSNFDPTQKQDNKNTKQEGASSEDANSEQINKQDQKNFFLQKRQK